MGPSNSRLEIREKYGIVKRRKNIQARVGGTHGALTDAANLQIGRLCLTPRGPLVAKTVVSKHWLLPCEEPRPQPRATTVWPKTCRPRIALPYASPIWVL
jgi:hypothetical protein